MLFWSSALTLMADALEVMDMRVRQIAAGSGTSNEMFLMVREKLDAASAAGSIIIRGGDCGQVPRSLPDKSWQPMSSGWALR